MIVRLIDNLCVLSPALILSREGDRRNGQHPPRIHRSGHGRAAQGGHPLRRLSTPAQSPGPHQTSEWGVQGAVGAGQQFSPRWRNPQPSPPTSARRSGSSHSLNQLRQRPHNVRAEPPLVALTRPRIQWLTHQAPPRYPVKQAAPIKGQAMTIDTLAARQSSGKGGHGERPSGGCRQRRSGCDRRPSHKGRSGRLGRQAE